MDSLTILDLVIVIFVLLGMMRGFKEGLIQSVVGFLGWLIALILGTKLAPVFSSKFSGLIDSEVLQLALGFLAVVILVVTILHLVALLMKKILEKLKLNFLDKMAGGVLGAFKNIIIILVILNFSSPIFVKLPMWQVSVLAPELLPYAPLANTMMKKAVSNAWERIDS